MKKIGIDLHGVLSDYPEKFMSVLEKSCKIYEVHILSGPPHHEVLDELHDLGYRRGIHFDFTFSVVEHLSLNNIKMWKDENSDWWSTDDNWWAAKGNYCKEKGIELLIDNSIKYKDYLPVFTEFILIKNEIDIDKTIKLLENINE